MPNDSIAVIIFSTESGESSCPSASVLALLLAVADFGGRPDKADKAEGERKRKKNLGEFYLHFNSFDSPKKHSKAIFKRQYAFCMLINPIKVKLLSELLNLAASHVKHEPEALDSHLNDFDHHLRPVNNTR